ncbi:TetR/AcrR family transcriptional regulator [uncultured Kiloniella sp.]|uniref:TetR/AcrR family transcriptional regulator n=1 Tax=uncultured Kiloniella sp. TaxID=1133091 RepID=UPI002620B760|nr:TetR/AcrR family transcriptional regulator [uncultured Kiloniella sp.]
MPKSREQQNNLKREAIAAATLSLLDECGGEGLSMRRVAEKSGISLGNLQYHYKNKEELLSAILDDFLKQYLAENWGEQKSNSLEHTFLRILTHSSFDSCAIVFKELWSLSTRHEAIDDMLVGFYRQTHRFFCQILASSCSSSVGQDRITRTVNILMPFFEGYCVTKKALRSDPEILAQDLASFAENLMETESFRKKS